MARGDDTADARKAVDASLAELATSAGRVGDGAVAPEAEPEQQIHANFAQAHVYLALAAKLNGDLKLAQTIALREAPFHRTGVFAQSESAVTYLINTAKLEQALGNLDAALALANEAVAVSQVAERDSEVEQLGTRALQATILEDAGKLVEAARVYEESRQAWLRIGGENHPKVITALNNLGLNAARQGDFARGIELLEEACRRSIITHGERHQHTLDNHGNLALAYDGAGRLDDAVALIERLLPVIQAERGSPSIDECDWLYFLAQLRAKQGRNDEALALLTRVCQQGEGLVGAEVTVREAQKMKARLARVIDSTLPAVNNR